jgi:hypothetical protein
MPSPIAVTALLEPIPRKPISPKAAARFAERAFRALLRFPTRTVRKPQAVVALATIESSHATEKDGLLAPTHGLVRQRAATWQRSRRAGGGSEGDEGPPGVHPKRAHIVSAPTAAR